MKKILILLTVLGYSTIGISQFDLVISKQNTLNTIQYNPKIYTNLILKSLPGQDSSTMITDLTPFLGVDSVFGDITIENTAITSLDGLQELEFMGNLIIYNNALLQDASNFQAPKYVMDLEIYQNPELLTFSGLNTIQFLSSLRFENNPKLGIIDISLDSLVNKQESYTVNVIKNGLLQTLIISDPKETMTGVRLDSNSSLTHLHVRASNDSILSVVAQNNALLTNITGFQDATWLGAMRFQNNASLSKLCFIQESLNNGFVGLLTLSGNAQGANSEAEILATDCSDFNTGIDAVDSENELSIYPNPAHDEVYVGVPEKATRYTIYSVAGKLVQQGNVESNGRIGLTNLPNGLYVMQIGNERSKLVVQ